jgi:hypothetical protein
VPPDASHLASQKKRRPRRLQARRRPVALDDILAWADAHRKRTGQWPTKDSGVVQDVLGELWYNIDAALRQGSRGLPTGGSLTHLLEERRGVRNKKGLARLLPAKILAWADAFCWARAPLFK